MQRLTSTGLLTGTGYEISSKLRGKFFTGSHYPQASVGDDLFRLGQLPCNESILKLQSLNKALRSCPRLSGPGCTGSRYEHLLPLLSVDSAFRSFHRLCEDILIGRVPGGPTGIASTTFLTGLLTPLKKGDEDVRPLAAPEPIRRLLARAVCTEYRSAFAEALEPLQCAVGVAGGAEIAQKTVDAFAKLHPDYAFFKLDAENAYCSQWRRTAVEQACVDIPELAPFWRLCYVRPSQSQYLYRHSSQPYWIFSDTGVDQGDGLAPVLFSFGMKPGANALLKALQERAQGRPVLLLLYLDDVIVAVPKDLSLDVLPLASAAFGPGLHGAPGAGLTFKLGESGQCKVWSPSGLEGIAIPNGVRWNDGAFVFLGLACHELELGNSLLDLGMVAGDTQAGIASHWDSVSNIASRLADTVLSLYHERMDIADVTQEVVMNTAQIVNLLHLLRAYPPHLLQDQIAKVDQHLQCTFLALADATPSWKQASKQLCLRIRDGGFGIGTLQARHAAAYLGSWAQCLAGVVTRLPSEDAHAIVQAFTEHVGPGTTIWEPVAEAQHIIMKQGLAPGKLIDWADAAVAPLFKMQRSLYNSVARASMSRLLEASNRKERARLRSCGGLGGGAFLWASPVEGDQTEVTDGAFAFSIRWRLGLPLTNVHGTCQVWNRAQSRACGAPLDPFWGAMLQLANAGASNFSVTPA